MSTVFFLGATGCVGGPVLEVLVKAYPHFTYKALVRNESALEAFNEGLGITSTRVEAVKGTFEDSDLITQYASESDFVINTADSDNVSLKDALLKGFKKRFEEGKGLCGFIQTSGCAIFFDGVMEGRANPDGKMWTDDEKDVRALTEKQMHGQIDVPILKAQEEGYFNAFIVVPPGIHGVGGPLKRPSVFFKYAIGDALQHRRVSYIGEGTNVFGYINVNDLAPLYLLLFKRLVEANGKKLTSSPYERYVIAHDEFGDAQTLFNLLATELHKHGKVDSPQASSVAPAEASPVLTFMASQNMLCRAGRASTLGWKPTHAKFQETVAEDVALSLAALA